MKILKTYTDKYNEEDILNFVRNYIPVTNANFSFQEIKEFAGWTNIICNINTSKFFIEYSSALMEHSAIIEFFSKIISLENNEIAIFIENEGSYPLLYAEKFDDEHIRFLFAHDYELFANDEIKKYCLKDYKIECDIVINKKVLLKNFYNIIYPFIRKQISKFYYERKLLVDKWNNYLNNIKKYLDKNNISFACFTFNIMQSLFIH